MDKLGKMIRITDLRSVWPHEANDFTKWLALEENLALLSDAIDIELELEERESSVGSFNVDIFAKEVGTNRRVIIENQLEDTNHDHLGKLITYASGKGAEVIVWVVKRARDEHRQAIEWLNQHTDSNIGFFLLEIELWQIGDSEKAPRFNIVEKPNDWSKTMKTIEGLSDTNLLKLEFWTGFNDAMSNNDEFKRHFRTRKASPQHWYDLSIGSSAYHVCLTINTQKQYIGADIYIDDNKELFAQFKNYKNEIAAMLNSEVEWREAEKACRIFISTNINPKKRENWQKAYDWFLKKALIYKEIASKYGE
ncbi:MAG: DUF4268 domain-containing protein [Bacteroidales bacterium]|jgi:hypothetical protein|nr:DUF4268 domain-containing protein [Bacteroidales bacterium]